MKFIDMAMLFLLGTGLFCPLIAQEAPGTITTVPGIGYIPPGRSSYGGQDGSGGMTVDERGNLFVCSECMVYHKSPDGTTKVVIGQDFWNPRPVLSWDFIFLLSIADGIKAIESLVFSSNSADQVTPDGLPLSAGMAVDIKGNLYVASGDRQRIRRAGPDGFMWTVAGGADTTRYRFSSGSLGNLEIPPGFSGDGGPARQAFLNKPTDVALDAHGNLYIADYGNNRIRLVDREGFIRTFAGSGLLPMTAEAIGDGDMAVKAALLSPVCVAADLQGNVYVAELYGHRVRRIATDGQHTITTFAGTGEPGFSGDGGLATEAQLNGPMGLAVDVEGSVYIADYRNHRVRRVTRDGIINTYAGTEQSGAGVSGDGGPATQARLTYPRHVALDAKGYLYVTSMETESRGVVRRVSPAREFEIPSIRLSSTSVPFLAKAVNSTVEQILTVANPAKETPLQVELMVEHSPPEFKLIPTNFLVHAGGSQAVQVRFTPGTLRPTSATLRIYHSGVEESPLRVSLNFAGAIRSADFDGDGKVDLDDFFLFAGAFGRDGAGEYTRYDLDGDWKIGFDDFFLFAGQFGK